MQRAARSKTPAYRLPVHAPSRALAYNGAVRSAGRPRAGAGQWSERIMAGKHDTQRIRYSFLQILTGSDLSRRRLALMEAASPEPGPVVWVTACAHGDEVGGIAVVQELFRRLRRTPLRRGRLCAFPLMNPTGFEMMTRHLGVTQDDLNRAFPGDANGSLAQRIAHLIFTAITETAPRLVIDLHNDWIKSIPYVVIDPPPAGPNRAIHTGLANL